MTLSLFTSPQVHYPTRMAQIGFEQGIRPKMGGLCNFSTGGGLSLLRSPCSPHRKSIIPPEWFELASSREFVQRWVGCATSPRGVDSRSVALPAHLTASPLSHPNGPNWLRAGNLPEDGWAVQPLHGGWTPVVTLFLLTSPQVHYPTRMVRIGFEQEIRPKIGGLCNFSTGVDFRCDAPISHLTASPLSHTNGSNCL